MQLACRYQTTATFPHLFPPHLRGGLVKTTPGHAPVTQLQLSRASVFTVDNPVRFEGGIAQAQLAALQWL